MILFLNPLETQPQQSGRDQRQEYTDGDNHSGNNSRSKTWPSVGLMLSQRRCWWH